MVWRLYFLESVLLNFLFFLITIFFGGLRCYLYMLNRLTFFFGARTFIIVTFKWYLGRWIYLSWINYILWGFIIHFAKKLIIHLLHFQIPVVLSKHAQNLVLKIFDFIFRFFRSISFYLLSWQLFLLIWVLIGLLGNISARRIRFQVILKIIQTVMILFLIRLLGVIVQFQVIISVQCLDLLFDLRGLFFIYDRQCLPVGYQLILGLAIKLLYRNVAIHTVLMSFEV